MRCQPLVGQIESLSSAPDCAQTDENSPDHDWFRQTEYVPFIPGIYKKKVVFQNYFKDLPETAPNSSYTPSSTSIATSETRPELVEGGVESKVYAPGLEIRAVFRVVKRNPYSGKVTLRGRERSERADPVEGGWYIVEDTEMYCKNALVKAMSVSQHRNAQKKMLDRIVHEASKQAYKLPPS